MWKNSAGYSSHLKNLVYFSYERCSCLPLWALVSLGIILDKGMQDKPFQVPVAKLLWNGKGTISLAKLKKKVSKSRNLPGGVSTLLLQCCCPLSHFQCFQSIFSLLIPTFEQFPNPVLTVASPQGEKSPQAALQAGFAWSFITCLTWMGAPCSAVPWAGHWCDAHHFLGTWWEKAARQCQEQGGREDFCILCRALLWTIFTSSHCSWWAAPVAVSAEVPIHTTSCSTVHVSPAANCAAPWGLVQAQSTPWW